MSTSQLNSVVALMLVASIMVSQKTAAQADIYQYPQKRPSVSVNKYCGKHLSNALQLLCNGVYNPMFKKSGQEMEMDDFPFAYDESYPFRSRASANAMMGRFGGGRFRRDSRGVHDECCMKPCTVEELSNYCAV